jgi:phage-related protein
MDAAVYPIGYTVGVLRQIRFLGDSLKCLRDFPEDARHDAGYQLDKVQHGEQPDDFKPMAVIGAGVEEIRIILHAFQKKTQATAKKDIETARRRFAQLTRGMK